MKQFIVASCIGVLCGCYTPDCFISPTSSPVVGEQYDLPFRTLKVVQVCDKEVHVMEEHYQGLRVGIIPLVNDYVTEQYLRTGRYEYVGPYTYKTIKDMAGNEKSNTIRLFKEVKVEE